MKKGKHAKGGGVSLWSSGLCVEGGVLRGAALAWRGVVGEVVSIVG